MLHREGNDGGGTAEHGRQAARLEVVSHDGTTRGQALGARLGQARKLMAQALDAGSVRVSAPLDPGQRVDYLSILENLEVEAGQAVAKVIINARTGTIVIGQNVKVQPAAVTHGSLTVTITEEPIVSQPNALAGGDTVVVPKSKVSADQEAKPMFKFGPGTTLDEIVRAVNQVGASPSDLMAILEALKQAGALQADLIVI